MTRITLLSMVGLAILSAASAQAQVPSQINYQGHLTDAAGNPLTGVYVIRFTIYDDLAGTTVLWTENQPAVSAVDGNFSVLLGSVVPIPNTIFTGPTRGLGIKIGADPELSPLTPLVSTPYAFRAGSAATSYWTESANLLTPLDPNDTVDIGPSAHSSGGAGDYNGRLNVSGLGTALRVKQIPGLSRPALFATAEGTNLAALLHGGSGLQVQSSRVLQAQFVATSSTAGSEPIVAAQYAGPVASLDHIGVWARSVPNDYWGIGGHFEGGYIGARGIVSGAGPNTYYGLNGLAVGSGPTTCIGIGGFAENGYLGYGVYAAANNADSSIGIYAYAGGGSSMNYAGYFAGDINVTGTVVKSAALTRTDHPLDPDNQYLQTASVESPEMKNIYDGVVILGADGSAVVTLPAYIEAYNTDFRYQLTAIGASMPNLHIADEISGSRFRVAGGVPDMKVSWMITGVRNDRYAQTHPVEPELLKSSSDRGKYLHPELFGRGDDARIGPTLPNQAGLAEKNRKIDEAARAIGK